jgi:cell division initiation protein
MFDPDALRSNPAGPDGDRRMKVSPLDLRQLRFRTAFRGYDKAEVVALITEVADDYENALRDVDRLRQEVVKMEALLNQHREHERDLRDTLVTAQRVSDDIRTTADAQARQIVREAEGRSDLLLQKTQARLEDVQREIDGMKMKRREVETTLESTIASLRNTLEFVREQEQREREDKILLHRPRPAEAPPQQQQPQPDLATVDKRRVATGNA